MKAIIIDSKKQEIRETEIDGKLAGLQAAVGGYIELVRLEDEQDLYVNEEGLLHGEQKFFFYHGAHQPFAGNGIICGHDDEGNTTGTSMQVEAVRARVKFLNAHEAYLAAVAMGA
jgi:hypothetical protein